METFRIVACPTLSHERRQDRYFESGTTLRECLKALGWNTTNLNARAFIDGRLVEAEWLDAKPVAGQAVVVRRVPQGGNGNQGKQIGAILGMLAIVVAAWFAPVALAGLSTMLGASGGVWGGIIAASGYIAAAVTVAGSLALNAHIPAPLPRRSLPRPARELKEAA